MQTAETILSNQPDCLGIYARKKPIRNVKPF